MFLSSNFCPGPQMEESLQLGSSFAWKVLIHATLSQYAQAGIQGSSVEFPISLPLITVFNFLTHLPYQLQVWHLGRYTRKLWHSWSTLDLVRRTSHLEKVLEGPNVHCYPRSSELLSLAWAVLWISCFVQPCLLMFMVIEAGWVYYLTFCCVLSVFLSLIEWIHCPAGIFPRTVSFVHL